MILGVVVAALSPRCEKKSVTVTEVSSTSVTVTLREIRVSE